MTVNGDKTLREKVVKLRSSKEFKHLSDYYNKKSLFNIIGVSRNENVHSNFLAWLLDPSESHRLGDYALRRFLELAVVMKNDGDVLWGDTEDSEKNALEKTIINNSYELDNVVCVREQSIEIKKDEKKSFGRIDLYITFDLKTEDLPEVRKVRIILENKVSSSEHDEQTELYYAWGEQDKTASNMYVFLSPQDMQCTCEHFLKVSYQNLLDYVLEPSLLECTNEASKLYLKEYLRTLSQPSLEFETVTKGVNVMAVSFSEKELLLSFWEKNEDLLETIIKTLVDSPMKNEPEEVELLEGFIESNRDLLLAVFNASWKNEDTKMRKNLDKASIVLSATKMSFDFDGVEYKTQSRIVLAILKKYAEKYPDQTYEEVNVHFGLKGIQEILPFSDLPNKTEDTKRRYFRNEADQITLNGEKCLVSTQWGWPTVKPFLGIAERHEMHVKALVPWSKSSIS